MKNKNPPLKVGTSFIYPWFHPDSRKVKKHCDSRSR